MRGVSARRSKRAKRPRNEWDELVEFGEERLRLARGVVWNLEQVVAWLQHMADSGTKCPSQLIEESRAAAEARK